MTAQIDIIAALIGLYQKAASKDHLGKRPQDAFAMSQLDKLGGIVTTATPDNLSVSINAATTVVKSWYDLPGTSQAQLDMIEFSRQYARKFDQLKSILSISRAYPEDAARRARRIAA